MSNEQIYQPRFPLNQFVDFIWVGRASSLNVVANHYAPLFTELIFNYGDDFEMTGQNIEQIVNTNQHCIVSGLKTEPFQTKVLGLYACVGLILKPYCYKVLIEKLRTPLMSDLSNLLYELVYDTDSPNFDKVESYLLQLFSEFKFDRDLVQFEKYISTQPLGNGAMKKFNNNVSISQKNFIHKFKGYYSLTPNQYINLQKINTAVQLIQQVKNTQKLVEVGLDAGFYDQSHFIRVFKKFSGCTPKTFAKSISWKSD